METINENGFRVLVAESGKVLQSVTDGLVIGPRLILGSGDSEKHYAEIPEPAPQEGEE